MLATLVMEDDCVAQIWSSRSWFWASFFISGEAARRKKIWRLGGGSAFRLRVWNPKFSVRFVYETWSVLDCSERLGLVCCLCPLKLTLGVVDFWESEPFTRSILVSKRIRGRLMFLGDNVPLMVDCLRFVLVCTGFRVECFYPATGCVNKTCSGSLYWLRRGVLGVWGAWRAQSRSNGES